MLTGLVNIFNVEFERKIGKKDGSIVFVITAQLFFNWEQKLEEIAFSNDKSEFVEDAIGYTCTKVRKLCAIEK